MKGAIDGARGIAYGTSGSLSVSTDTGTPDVTKPDNDGVTDKDKDDKEKDDDKKDGESKVVEDATDAAKEVVEAGGPLTDPMDNTNRDGWYDIDSVLQGAKDALGKYPPKEGDPLCVNALTGLVDASTRSIIAIFKEAVHGMIGDPSRDSLNEKVVDPDYTPGYYWSAPILTPNTTDFTTLTEAVDAIIVLLGIMQPGNAPWTDGGWQTPPNPPSNPTGIRRFLAVDGVTFNDQSISQVSCTVSDSLFLCPITSPALAWADLGATQLAWVTTISAQVSPFTYDMVGKFCGHPYDSNIPAVYEDGASILDLLNNTGNTVRIGPLAAGGWYVYYSDAGTGLPAGAVTDASVLKINANRTHGGFMTPNQLATRLPPTS